MAESVYSRTAAEAIAAAVRPKRRDLAPNPFSPPPAPRQPEIAPEPPVRRLAPSAADALVLLLKLLPDAGTWSPAARSRWLGAFTALLDLHVAVVKDMA